MLVCHACGERKSQTEFYLRKSGARAGEYYTYCKDCYKKKGRRYYQLHRDTQRLLSNARRRKYRVSRHRLVLEMKKVPCADCGKRYPHYVMDFDHHEGIGKLGNISNLINRNFLSMEKLRKEIEKCDVVCANCHRIRTFARMKNKREIE